MHDRKNKPAFVIDAYARRIVGWRSLNLIGTRVEDVEPLKGLTALHTLDLSRTRVENVEPLKGLTALQELDLGDTKVENVEPNAVEAARRGHRTRYPCLRSRPQ
jgi:internalin A